METLKSVIFIILSIALVWFIALVGSDYGY
jgi:hypothetical protein